MFIKSMVNCSGTFVNDDANLVREQIMSDLTYGLKYYNDFKIKKVEFSRYRFGIVDFDMSIDVHDSFNDEFYEKLKKSTRKFVIFGDNFNIATFPHLKIFQWWFHNY